MTTTISMLNGTCECGAAVSREQTEGFGADLLNTLPFLCPECSQKREQEWMAEDVARQEREDRDWLESKLKALPPALREHRLADLDTEGRSAALAAADRWARGELKGLVLLGNIGVGKTTIAAATVRTYMVNHLRQAAPRWINTVQALNDLARDFTDRRRVEAMNALDGQRVALVLDDIDKAKPNANAAAIIFGAIDAAITNHRQLIVTTNLMPSQLAAYWPKPHGQAVASRLAGYCEMHKITGVDRRVNR